MSVDANDVPLSTIIEIINAAVGNQTNICITIITESTTSTTITTTSTFPITVTGPKGIVYMCIN